MIERPPDSPAPEAVEPLSELPVAVEISLRPALAPEAMNRRDEQRGLVTALVELGLADLQGVVPSVEGAAPALGLALTVRAGAQRWTAQPAVDALNDSYTVSLELCDPAGVCESSLAVGKPEAPQEPIATVLEWAAARLGRELRPQVRAGWQAPLSKDGYAILLAGRSAATLYGLREGVPEALLGDKRLDPIDRAAFVDPFLSVASWVLARRDGARGAYDRARDALPRGGAAHPWSVVFAAEDAALLDRLGKPELAYPAWQDVVRKAPADVRFVVPLARAALRAGDLSAATAALDSLPAWAQEDAEVLRVRVGVAGRGADDALLSRLQAAAPEDPEPVRRRLELRVRDGRYAEALALTAELRARGAVEEADKLALSLAVGAGDLAAARDAAGRLGLTEVQARLVAREALAKEPARLDAVPPGDDPILTLVRAEAARQAGQPEEALRMVGAVLSADPWMPEALEIRAEALDDLGRLPEADEARQRLAMADPAR